MRAIEAEAAKLVASYGRVGIRNHMPVPCAACERPLVASRSLLCSRCWGDLPASFSEEYALIVSLEGCTLDQWFGRGATADASWEKLEAMHELARSHYWAARRACVLAARIWRAAA